MYKNHSNQKICSVFMLNEFMLVRSDHYYGNIVSVSKKSGISKTVFLMDGLVKYDDSVG